jgi:esterase/lipase superfamily enzyme
VDVLDLSKGQPKENLLKRVWRRIIFKDGELRAGQGRTNARKFDLLSETKFKAVLSKFRGRGAVAIIHGYANTFDAALNSASQVAYHSRLDKLELLPVLFSWPSQGKMFDYNPDTGMAENSERPLLALLRLTAKAMIDKKSNVLAHSHANKLLVRSLSDAQSELANPIINQMVLVAPDVEVKFFTDRIEDMLKATNRITVYHANNDRALSIAEFIFKNDRVGRAGLNARDVRAEWSDKLELIDASLVSRGLSRHAPHIEAPEVISDIHHLLRGAIAGDRFNLNEEDRKTCRWKMRPQ